MVARTARTGPRAGQQFWGCTAYPRCRNIVNVDSSEDGKTDDRSGSLGREKVTWSNALNRRTGWIARFTTGGGRLRAISLTEEAQQLITTCFIARQDRSGFARLGPEGQRVTGVVRKILQRGACPPVHPAAERAILSVLGLDGAIIPSPIPGDLSVELDRTLPKSSVVGDSLAHDGGFEIEGDLAFDSNEERLLLDWVAKELGELAIRWVTPQASLDRLAAAAGLAVQGEVRVDFLFAPPHLSPWIVEVDGVQHDSAGDADESRDALAAAIGIDVIRVPTSEVRLGSGPNLEKLRSKWTEPAAVERWDELRVVLPAQVFRAGLAILEALEAGFLAGEVWSIDLLDSTESVAQLLGPTFELITAIDELWGSQNVVPDRVLLKTEDELWQFQRQGSSYDLTDSKGVGFIPDVEIRLESDRTPIARLVTSSIDVPCVIVRAAFVPARVLDVQGEGPERLRPGAFGPTVSAALRKVLETVFAKSDFREGQLEAVLEVLAGRDCVVLLPTGSGKSLIYQLAGLCLPGRTLVVDPITSLIEDQVQGMLTHGIDRVTAISMEMNERYGSDVLEREVSRGDALFILIAPERLQRPGFRNALRALTILTPINLAVIDEAHCVSDWGHSFRPSYLLLGDVLRRTCQHSAQRPLPLLALTGTASRAVLKDVIAQLGLAQTSPHSTIKAKTFDRPELHYHVFRAKPSESDATLQGALRRLPAMEGIPAADYFEARGRGTRSGLIFCPTINGYHSTFETALSAQESLHHCPPTYSTTAPRIEAKESWNDKRRTNAQRFMSNDEPVLVATNAFGMGIDKPNIRWTMHFGIPGSIEAFYQEVGRAGRDRQTSNCLLILTENDYQVTMNLLDETTPIEDARSIFDKLPRNQRDDVSTALFFHLSSFRGTNLEMEDLKEVLTKLQPTGTTSTVVIDLGKDQKFTEGALGRLIRLGVVDDYVISGRSLSVTVNPCTVAMVRTSLQNYIERFQAGRWQSIEGRLVEKDDDLQGAILACAKELIDYTYQIVERARRRSLREMWLAARQSDDGEELRRRVLDYLTEGEVAPKIERLSQSASFDFGSWRDEIAAIANPQEAQEWRGATARLLTSDPDHTGLLLARALCELADSKPNLDELASNLDAAIVKAPERFSLSESEIDEIRDWVAQWVSLKGDEALLCVESVFDQREGISPSRQILIDQSLDGENPSIGLAVLNMARSLRHLNDELDNLLMQHNWR